MEYLNPELEKVVLATYLRKDNSLEVTVEDFAMDEARLLFEFAQSKRMCDEDMQVWQRLYKSHLLLIREDTRRHLEFLKSLWALDLPSESELRAVVEQLHAFTHARMLQGFYVESIDCFKKGEIEQALEVLKRGLLQIDQKIAVVERGDYVEDFNDRLKEYEDRCNGYCKIPIGIAALDDAIGGVAPCSLNFIQGESSVGKTFFLQEIAISCMKMGYVVVFITIEMRKIEIEFRWDSRVSGIPYRSITNSMLDDSEMERWRNSVQMLRECYKKGGRLGVSFVPEGCLVSTLDAECDYWEKRWNKKVDVLVIDYADLMATTRRTYSEQEMQGVIYRDLKRLSQTRNIVVWTASQVAGKSYGKMKLDLGDTGYSMRKANWANLVLGIAQDDEDNSILHVWVAKNTFGRRNFEVMLKTDYDYALVDTIGRSL